MKYNHFTKYLIFFILITSIKAQVHSVYEEDTVVVTGGRIPQKVSEISRNVQIIDRKNIKEKGAANIGELLEENTSVDLKSRGPRGVQSDISIRGSNTNQNVVMIDGVKVNDPQTGHHNLNIPVTTFDIDRIELLKGSGSRLHGPNAFGGAINVLTKTESEYATNIRLAYGENEYFDRTISAVLPMAGITNRFSYSRQTSDGYRRNTDFDMTTFFYKSAASTQYGDFSLTGGYLDKEFGANEFYTPGNYPNQWENTETIFWSLQHDYKREWGKLNTKLSWREHQDRYLLDKEDPEFYENTHETDLYTGKMNATVENKFITTNIGTEIGQEKIESNSLGNHSRKRMGFYLEGKKDVGELTITPGVSTFYYSNWDWQVLPGLDFSYKLSEDYRLVGSVGKSFRIPTYTNLYYNGPVNKGNPNLKPEKAWNYELGLKYGNNWLSSEMMVFTRDNYNLIDWQENTDSTWKAQNINEIRMNGVELSARLNRKNLSQKSFLNKLKISYTYLQGNRNVEYRSKYVFNYLQHNAILNIGHNIFDGIKSLWSIRYEDRKNGSEYYLVDLNTYMKYRGMKIYLKVSNLMDKQYESKGYIPMPGRWITGGIEFSL